MLRKKHPHTFSCLPKGLSNDDVGAERSTVFPRDTTGGWCQNRRFCEKKVGVGYRRTIPPGTHFFSFKAPRFRRSRHDIHAFLNPKNRFEQKNKAATYQILYTKSHGLLRRRTTKIMLNKWGVFSDDFGSRSPVTQKSFQTKSGISIS